MQQIARLARFLTVGGIVALLAGCTGGYAVDDRGVVVYPDPVVVEPGIAIGDRARRRAGQSYRYDIPDGHYPPPGSCRVWYPDRPAGQQPPPGPCNVRVPYGAVLIEG